MAQDVEFLGGRHDGERDAPPEEPAGMAQQEQKDPETGMTVVDPEDIPY